MIGICEDLRKAVLQAAIEGKLTEQLESDGNAETLYAEIQQEKQRLIKEGKIKKEKPLKPIDPDETPFEIPNNWKWCRFGDLVEIARGGSPRPIQEYITNSANGINWIKIGDTDKGGKYINATQEKIKPEGLKKSRYVEKGDFLLSNSMSFGRPYILNIDGAIHDGWLVIKQHSNVFDKDYLYYLLSSQMIYNQFCERVSGAVVNNLNSIKVAQTIVPLPPLAEQQRIVFKVDKLMAKIDEMENTEKSLTDLYNTFPDDIKASLLQAAIQGRLTEQLPSDGDAETLYAEIQDEKKKLIKEGKIKKEKTVEPINPDEVPFDIPDNWKWVRLKDIVYNRGQKTPNTKFSYIDIGSIDNSNQKLSSEENIIDPSAAPSRARKIVEKGDIIYSTVRPYLHNMAIIDKVFSCPPIASTGFAVMVCHSGINNRYLFYYLLSPDFDKYANDTSNSKGVAYPAINDEKLYKALIPLPPLAEQDRIVEKLDQLLPLCNKIKNSIQE